MASVPPLQHSVSIWTYCGMNWIPTALCVLVFTGWHFGVTRELSTIAVLFFIVLCVTCYLAGTLILRVLPVSSVPIADYPFAFLLGYFFISPSLFLLALVTTFGVRSQSDRARGGHSGVGSRDQDGACQTRPPAGP